MRLLLATHNKAKIKYYSKFLNEFYPELEIFTLDDVSIFEDVDETGSTFEENALLKAQYYADKTKMLSLADDGGICIDALGGKPGLYSKRWAGKNASDKDIIDFTLDALKDVDNERRTAYFIAIIAIYNPHNSQVQYFTTKLSGKIAQKPAEKLEPGFPYRSLFLTEKSHYLVNLSEKELEEIDHRRKACKDIAEYLKNMQ